MFLSSVVIFWLPIIVKRIFCGFECIMLDQFPHSFLIFYTVENKQYINQCWNQLLGTALFPFTELFVRFVESHFRVIVLMLWLGNAGSAANTKPQCLTTWEAQSVFYIANFKINKNTLEWRLWPKLQFKIKKERYEDEL